MAGIEPNDVNAPPLIEIPIVAADESYRKTKKFHVLDENEEADVSTSLLFANVPSGKRRNSATPEVLNPI
jgi:hypothetical protein